MDPATTKAFLSDHLLKAMCNTLMHSLWQGILLAVITGAMIIFTKKMENSYSPGENCCFSRLRSVHI